MPENSTQEQEALLKGLRSSPGWKVLVHRIQEQLRQALSQLESDPNVDLKAQQERAKTLKWVVRQVEESRGEK